MSADAPMYAQGYFVAARAAAHSQGEDTRAAAAQRSANHVIRERSHSFSTSKVYCAVVVLDAVNILHPL